jgi:hypothetical protein
MAYLHAFVASGVTAGYNIEAESERETAGVEITERPIPGGTSVLDVGGVPARRLTMLMYFDAWADYETFVALRGHWGDIVTTKMGTLVTWLLGPVEMQKVEEANGTVHASAVFVKEPA